MKHNFEFSNADMPEGGGFIIRMPKRISSERQLMELYSREAQLPNYFGKNWDALDEVLRDLSWIKDKRVTILHKDLPSIGDDMLNIYLGILLRAINDWKEGESHEIHVVFPEAERTKILSIVNAFINS